MRCFQHENAEALGTCTLCGRAVCTDCRGEVNGLLRCPSHSSAATSAPPAWMPPPPPPMMPNRKSPGLAFFLGLFPGMGHIYLGLYQRAMMIFGVWVLMIFLANNASEFFGFGVAFMVFFSVLDAARMAKLINRGGFDEDPANLVAAQIKPGQGNLAAGVVFILLGLLAFIHKTWGIDFTFLADNWPVVMVIVGVWLVFRAVRVRKPADSGTESGAGTITA